MADPYVREVGHVVDMDGVYVTLGVDYDAVTLKGGLSRIAGARFNAAQAEEFAQLFVSAVWQAGQQKARMAEEVTGCQPPHGPDRRCFDCATDAEMAAAIPPPPGASDA
ncbi:MAG: hypothetical protein JWO67_1110 [Streptosporangiaceae bacterium]|nr:hypothetical protein [Streptosporangiaceae bacterium]